MLKNFSSEKFTSFYSLNNIILIKKFFLILRYLFKYLSIKPYGKCNEEKVISMVLEVPSL